MNNVHKYCYIFFSYKLFCKFEIDSFEFRVSSFEFAKLLVYEFRNLLLFYKFRGGF